MLKKTNYFVLQLLLYIYILQLVYPPATVYLPTVYVTFCCTMGWLLVSFVSYPQYYLQCKKWFFVAVVCYFYVSIMPRIFGNTSIGNRYMGMTMVFFGPTIYDFHKRTKSLKIIRNVVIVAGLFFAITALVTTIALYANPYATRSVNKYDEYSTAMAALGIGGYSIVYFGVLLIPSLLHALICDHSKTKRIIYLCLFILDFILIVLSNYVAAFVMTVIEIIVYVLSSIAAGKRYRLIKVLFGACLAATMIFVFPYIFDSVLELLPPRYHEIFNNHDSGSIFQKMYDEFLFDRFWTWQSSLRTISARPILGLTLSQGITTASGFLVGFGQHSFILDSLALYGIIVGMIIVWAAIFPVYKTNRGEKMTVRQKALKHTMLVGCIMMCLFNNLTDSVAFAISIVYLYTRDIYR